MKTNSILIASCLLILLSCKKEAGKLPELVTSKLTNIAQSDAFCGGKIISDGGLRIISQGVCWDSVPNPTISKHLSKDSIIGNIYECYLTGLSANSTYYVKAFAENAAGIGYGNEISFKTKPGISRGVVKDIDNNIYHVIIIGTQTWMEENLKTTLLNDSTTIPNKTNKIDWFSSGAPAYCWYDNNCLKYKNNYGALYNWYAVNTKKLCPVGWHVPSDEEWQALGDYLGGNAIAGGKLKESGTEHWFHPNTGATNESGFSALPAGFIGDAGSYNGLGDYAYWWSSSKYMENNGFDNFGWARIVYDYGTSYKRYFDWEGLAFSVRCIKD